MTPAKSLSHMDVALAEGLAAASRGEVPVGAVIVGPDGQVLAKAGNRTREWPTRPLTPKLSRSGRLARPLAKNGSLAAIST